MEVQIDSEKLIERNAGQLYLKEQFGFPEYYGYNLDALYDMLTEMTEDTVIHYTGFAHETEGGQEAERVLRVLLEAAYENGHIRVCREA